MRKKPKAVCTVGLIIVNIAVLVILTIFRFRKKKEDDIKTV